MPFHRSNLPAHENGLHEEATIHAYFADIWLRMGQCMERGMKAEGVLPVRSAFPGGRRRLASSKALSRDPMNVVDDLLKPVTRDRLELTLERLRTDRRSQDFSVLPEANHLHQIPCFGQHMVYFLKIDAVECVESRAGVCVTDLEASSGQRRCRSTSCSSARRCCAATVRSWSTSIRCRNCATSTAASSDVLQSARMMTVRSSNSCTAFDPLTPG